MRHQVPVYVWCLCNPYAARFVWSADLTVGEAAVMAARAFGYRIGIPHLRDAHGVTLAHRKTLAEAGVTGAAKLDLLVMAPLHVR